MRIVVASGKGGTGKTMVATSLALSLDGSSVLLLDCDVEAPDAHLFITVTMESAKEVGVLLPSVDEMRCTGRGRCSEVCQFGAIAVMGGRPRVFPDLCHGCGSCTLCCPEKALTEALRVTGRLEAGRTAAGMHFAQGVMNTGEVMAVPVIRELKRWERETWLGHRKATPNAFAPPWETVIVDAPPGTSCPVVETLRGGDFALLVTEPTPFGLHDLRLMVEVVRDLDVKAGVIVNRDGIGDAPIDDFCAAAGLPVLMHIPMEREIAEGTAQGRPLTALMPTYIERFGRMYDEMERIVTKAVG